MAHYAKVDKNNIVLEVNVVDNNVESEKGEAGVVSWLLEGWGGENWIKTSYNSSIRGNYAGIGDTYDATNDVFYAPQPFPSWTLNETTWTWDAPVAYPLDGKMYEWKGILDFINDIESLNEAKATCCHRCGRVHVKGTPCKKPYLKGKKSCAINEIETLKEFYSK